MTPRVLTILNLTHQGEGAGSTQSIFSLSRELARHGHRVLVGCPDGTLLSRMVVAAAPLTHVPLDFNRFRGAANAIAGVVRDHGVDVVNSHASRDRRACTWLRWRRRLPQAFVVTRRTMPLTSPPELIAVGLTADRTIAVSAAVARSLRNRLHPASRLRVVPNGINLERVDTEPQPAELEAARAALQGSDGNPVVVVVARRKDQQIPLRALTALESPVTLAFVGMRPDRELAAAQERVPPRLLIVYVPFSERRLAFDRFATFAASPSRSDCLQGNRLVNIGNMSLPAPVTAVIPTLNEANQIADCVRAVTWADEVIVADGGSSDQTTSAAAAAGAKVLQGSWNTIAAQRNAGIAAARNQWV